MDVKVTTLHSFLTRFLSFTFLFLIFISVSFAEEQDTKWQDNLESQEIQLEELTEVALKRNPDIQEARAKWGAAQKRIPQSWALPDPVFGIDIVGEETQTRVGPQDSRISFTQKIPFPLKLLKKYQVAQKEAEEARENYRAINQEIRNQLNQAYFALYEVDASIEVIREVHDLLKKFEGVAQARYANIGGTQRDVAKAQAEVSLTLEQLMLLAQRRESLVGLINSLLNRSPLLGLGQAIRPNLPGMHQTLPELVSMAQINRQEIKAMEARVAKARHQKSLAKLENMPDVQFGFSYTFVGNGKTNAPDDGNNSWMFPLRVNVPLWQNRIIPHIQEAQKDVEAAWAKLLSVQNEAFYEVKDAHVRFKTGAKIVNLYETAVIPQANLALTSDQAGYEAGKTDFLNLLDSERVYLNAKLTHIKIYAETLRSFADLERATGLAMLEVAYEK